MGLWSEQERWYLKAEDVQVCVWVGFEGKGLLTPKAEMAVEQCTWLRETWDYFYLKPDCGRQNHMFGTLFKSNGSRGTQTEAILALDVKSQQLCASGKGGKYCVVIENDVSLFSSRMKAASGLYVSRLVTSHFTHMNPLRVIVSPTLLFYYFLKWTKFSLWLINTEPGPLTSFHLQNTWGSLNDIFQLARENKRWKMLPYCREKHKHLISLLQVTPDLCSLDNCP